MMTIFDSEILEDRQRRVAQAFGDDAPVVLIGAGEPIPKPGGHDQVYPFIPYPQYYWLTGSRRWGGVLVFDPLSGWTHFVRPVADAERLWEGGEEDVVGEDVGTLNAWLVRQKDRKIVAIGVGLGGVSTEGEWAREMALRLDSVRRHLDVVELDFVEKAVLATAAGHKKASEVIGQGVTERQVQIALENEMMRYGAHDMGYGTIVGAGDHAAVLHFDPSNRVIGENDLVLIDAGGAVFGYTADVTRTYPTGEKFMLQQQAIYDIVLKAEFAAIAQCRVGVEWHDVHMVAARVIAEGLCDLGILKGAVDTLLESGAVALFLPHGVGHMLGLGVRGVGGYAPGRDGTKRYCGVRIRVDMPLEEDFLMTVEPGIYFVPALLNDPAKRTEFRNMVNWDILDSWRTVGGVRIEDNVLITNEAPRILTEGIPK
jgi:Xaa-Pro aminopeptidase